MVAQKKVQRFTVLTPQAGATRMTCAEAYCIKHANGWITVLDPANEEQADWARWIRDESKRRFVCLDSATAYETLLAKGGEWEITVTPEMKGILDRTPAGMLVFIFAAGQTCFREHLDREVTFLHREGLQLPNGQFHETARRVHARPLDYNEHQNEAVDRIQTAIERG